MTEGWQIELPQMDRIFSPETMNHVRRELNRIESSARRELNYIESSMKKGFHFPEKICPKCHRAVKENWLVKHIKSNCTLPKEAK